MNTKLILNLLLNLPLIQPCWFSRIDSTLLNQWCWIHINQHGISRCLQLLHRLASHSSQLLIKKFPFKFSSGFLVCSGFCSVLFQLLSNALQALCWSLRQTKVVENGFIMLEFSLEPFRKCSRNRFLEERTSQKLPALAKTTSRTSREKEESIPFQRPTGSDSELQRHSMLGIVSKEKVESAGYDSRASWCSLPDSSEELVITDLSKLDSAVDSAASV